MKTTSTTSNLLTTNYAEKVIKGEIIASLKVKKACERHLNDLKRQDAEGFPWTFDEERAYRPIKFIEKYCKPSKGNFDKLVMQPWQHFIIGSMYGWIHKDTGLRRYKYGLVMVGRKNGKSGLASGLAAYGCSKDGERGADVYVLANSMKQVRKTIFEECQKMIKASPSLRKHFRVTRDAIYFDKSFSTIEPQASDSEKLDGLNTHLGIFDEIHEYKDYKLINIIKNSTGSRDQPILFYITTAGYQLDGPLVDYYEKAADVLDGVIEDERTFYYIAEIDEDDEVDDPANWIKANPNLGVTLQLDTMIEEWETRKHIPAERNDFITKRLNVFADSGEQSFLDYEVIKRNDKVIDINTLNGLSCVGGFDLSNTEDFTSACLEFPLPDTGEVFVLSHSWIPRKKVISDNEKIPYMEYAKAGLLTICNGDYIDHTQVYDWFIEQSQKYQIEKITYDPANAFRLVKDLETYGFDMVLVRQGYITLSPALKDIKNLFLDGNVISNKNRLLRWYINNVQLVEDRNGNWMPTKQNRYRKIDGFAALLNAHSEVMEKMTTPQGNGDVGVISMKDLLA